MAPPAETTWSTTPHSWPLTRPPPHVPNASWATAWWPAEEPDWDRVGEQALALLQRTRDLRVAVHLATAWSRQQGWTGWADGLRLVQGAAAAAMGAGASAAGCRGRDDDPTARVNAVLALADPMGALGRLRTLPFVQSPRLGRFALRELRLADGTLKLAANAGATTRRPWRRSTPVALDCPLPLLASSAEAAHQSLQAARAIDRLLAEQLGASAPDLKPLLDDLATLDRFLQPRFGEARNGSDETPVEDGVDDGQGTAGSRPAAACRSQRIESTDDVRRRLDGESASITRCEVRPARCRCCLQRVSAAWSVATSSPLLRDLAPGDGMDELERVVGRSERRMIVGCRRAQGEIPRHAWMARTYCKRITSCRASSTPATRRPCRCRNGRRRSCHTCSTARRATVSP